jgi:ABC-type uncharacterized transport system YnjBCD substrate-binding protein
VPLVRAVHPSIPAKNVQELIAWIKANPDKASFATGVADLTFLPALVASPS